jgi:hypothetical protein
MNTYAEYAPLYLEKGYSVTPAKHMSKMPAIKGWTDYCFKRPTVEEVESWSRNFDKSGIDLCLGPASNVIALDLDTDRIDILNAIQHLFPESPCKKVGAKGYTLFFQYSGEQTEQIKFNGDVILELLAANKKTTLPPSIHPNGCAYKWEGTSLAEVDPASLPKFPPFLFSHIRDKLKQMFPDAQSDGFKVHSGRNNELSSLCGKLISDRVAVDEAIRQLIKADEKMHDVPLFTDPEEMPHTEAYTNALTFYTNHLNTVNRKSYRDSKEYETPVMKLSEKVEGKLKAQVKQEKKLNTVPLPVPAANSILSSLQNNILDNSWIPQPAFALSASLAVMSTLVARKLVFRGISPNLYLLNIGKSGSGKNMPQSKAKQFLINIGAERLLGAGDYVSDASLMDSLGNQPVRLDVMDEAGGILKSVTEGGTTYGGKMADILAELYTSSDDKYLGRATAEGKKGSCYRPNVNLLASTTPTGFSEGVSVAAIQKGLLGRFMMFIGNDAERSVARTNLPELGHDVKQKMKYWLSYDPPENRRYEINSIPQKVLELKATPEADKLLKQYFEENDLLRINTKPMSPLLPIIARLYTFIVKIAIIHCASRTYNSIPIINEEDVRFAKQTVDYTYNNMQDIVRKYVFYNKNERDIVRVLSLIEDNPGITKQEMFEVTKDLAKRKRDEIITDLVENGQINAAHGSTGLQYWRI